LQHLYGPTMFWKKRTKHPLPKFPSSVAPTFRMLCEALPIEEIGELRHIVDDNYDDFVERKRENQNLDLAGARQLTERCHYLLERYHDLSEEDRALVIGAVRYFAISEDPYDDETFASGLFDDKSVMNHVLERLGYLDKIIVLDN
jgi:hypothetical protein